jgi:hypothetical protein
VNAPMTAAVAVGSSEEFHRAQQIVWAALPLSVAATRGPAGAAAAAGLIAVDGRRADWLEVTADAVSSGAAGVLLVRPEPGPAGVAIRDLATLAADRSAVVVVQTAWAAHPAVSPLAMAASSRFASVALVVCLVVVTPEDPRTAAALVLDQVAFVRAVAGAIEQVDLAAGSAHGHSVVGRLGSAIVSLGAVRSATARATARVTLYAAEGEAHLELPDDGTAAPQSSWLVDAHGQQTQPTWYESAARASWRRLHEAVVGQQSTPDLTELAGDLELVSTITEQL